MTLFHLLTTIGKNLSFFSKAINALFKIFSSRSFIFSLPSGFRAIETTRVDSFLLGVLYTCIEERAIFRA